MINKLAVKHVPLSQDAFGLDANTVIIRMRTARDNLECCNLFFGDRSCRQTPVIFTKQQMQKIISDEFFDYYEAKLIGEYKRLCYYFELCAKDESSYYYGDLFSKELVDDRSEYYQLPYNHKADVIDVPEWVKSAVVYNIFPDSFASGKRFISNEKAQKQYINKDIKGTTNGKLGGTINGVTQNVDYFVDLGVNAIYLNPIFVAGEYHKYDLIDYFHIDPCFGSDEDFKNLVQTCHNNNIKVIIDGVFNHCGWDFFAFDDVVKNGKNSRYFDWFYNLTVPVIRPNNPEDYPGYECFGYERMMPKMNTQNREVVDYFCEVCRHWITKYDIDGWRLDVASEVNTEFWREFRRTALKAKDDIVLIGEVWESANFWVDGTMFDGAMNYDLRKHSRRFFAEKSIDALEFANRAANMYLRYRTNTLYAQLNLLDSHDVSRFLSLCDGDREKLLAAAVFQMTFVGMPCVFYGDEQGLSGVTEEEYRHPMIWDGDDLIFNAYKAAISMRKNSAALQTGDFKIISAKKGSKLFVYSRTLGGETIIAAINMGDDVSLTNDFKNCKILLEHNLKGEIICENGYVIAKRD